VKVETREKKDIRPLFPFLEAWSMSNIPRERPNCFERNPKKTLFALIVAICLLTDILGAQAYKLIMGYAWGSRSDYALLQQQKSCRFSSPMFHHDLAKNKSLDIVGWGPLRVRIRTNSLGFRDRVVREVPLVSNKHRILFIGDSFTEGVGFDYEHTFVGLIDSALADRGIEVLNAGVVSYSPIIYWRKIQYLIEGVGFKFDELVVFLDISDAQDEARFYYLDENGNVAMRSDPPGYLDRGDAPQGRLEVLYQVIRALVKDNTVLLYSFLHTLKGLMARPIGIEGLYNINFTRARWTIDNDVYNDYGAIGVKRMRFFMSKLAEMLSDHHIKLTVAVYPWPDQIISGDLDSIQVSIWEKWCQRHDARFINYFPTFIKDGNEAARKRVLEEYFIWYDVHWNRRGHGLVADGFLEFYGGRM
jgi:hypothetical protein